MLYARIQVFILENGNFIEIPYEEYCRRENEDLKDRFFISLHGCLMETTEE